MASRFWNQIKIQIEIRPKFDQNWLLCITLFKKNENISVGHRLYLVATQAHSLQSPTHDLTLQTLPIERIAELMDQETSETEVGTWPYATL